MTEYILSPMVASISELKANPMQVFAAAGGDVLTILNRNKPAFYCVPPKRYEAMLEALEDAELAAIVKKRAGEKEIRVKFDDL